MEKRKGPLNIFYSLNKLKIIYDYHTIFQVLRAAHLVVKLGFQNVKKMKNCLIEGSKFLKF